MAETLIESAHNPTEQDHAPEKSTRGSWRSRFETLAIVLLYLCAGASVIWQGFDLNATWFRGGDIISEAKLAAVTDVDQAVLLNHIEHHPTFASTFIWWHSAWLGQIYPWYWRPLTMLAFWTEYHLFGPYRFDRWQAAEIVFHVLFVVLLVIFVYRLTGSRIAPALTLLAFTTFAPLSNSLTVWGSFFSFTSTFTTPDAMVVLGNWKDQVEIWGGACILGAMILSMNGRWWAALACACLGVCFKESGWLVFPMVLIVLIYTRKLKEVPRSVWIGGAIAVIALLALRASGGPHLITQAHHDHRLHLVRFFLSLTDQNVRQLATDHWSVVILGFGLAWLVLTKRMRIIAKVATGAVLVLLSGAALGWSAGTNAIVGLALLVDPSLTLALVFYCFIQGLAVLLAWREPQLRRLAVMLYSLVIVSALTVLSVLQMNNHMLYLTNAFQSSLVAVFAVAACRQALLLFKPQQRLSTVQEPAA